MISIRNPILRWALRILMFLSLAFLLFMGGCYGLGKLIYAKRGCEEFQIDNTELHTGINIPAKKEIECNYIFRSKLKRTYFVIDKSKVNMAKYFKSSEFNYLPDIKTVSTLDFYRFTEDSLAQLQYSKSLYYKERQKTNGEFYKALLDTTSGRVWINLRYAD